MELMEMLKALFDGEALTFDQFAEKVNQSADVKLGNLANSNISFGEINGNSTYDDVYAELGEPMYNNITHGDVTYKRKDGYVTFTFDDNMNLTNFVYCIEDTH